MQITHPSRNISDLEYYNFSLKAYDRETNIGDEINLANGDQWTVIETLDDPDKNGIQAIAVAPVIEVDEKYKPKKMNSDDDKPKVDTSKIVIAYRGTEALGFDGDLTADITQVVLGVNANVERSKILGLYKLNDQTQFKSALDFANDIKDKYHPTDFSTTGHSLGGGESQYVSAELNIRAVTFAAPNVYKLLSDEAKERVHDGTMREQVRDYIHNKDIVGVFAGLGFSLEGDPLIGKQYVTAVNEDNFNRGLGPLAGHFMGTYEGKFDKNGNIEFKMNPAKLKKTINEFRPNLQLLKDWRRMIEQYIEDDAQATREMYLDMLKNVNGQGKYPLLTEEDVRSYFREQAVTVRGNDYYFIDVDMAEEICQRLTDYEEEMNGFLDELIRAAETTGTLDIEISSWFGRK